MNYCTTANTRSAVVDWDKDEIVGPSKQQPDNSVKYYKQEYIFTASTALAMDGMLLVMLDPLVLGSTILPVTTE